MNRKILRGTAAAFAAALAVTALAPAAVSEAASSKAYVVTEKKYGVGTGKDGDVTKYTYDSRGRVIKEVTTDTNASKTTLTGTATQKSNGTVETTVKDGDGNVYSYTVVASTSYDYEVAKLSQDAKLVTTTTYKYYNSGKKKDQKKSASTTIEEKVGVAYASNVEGASYGYIKARISTKETAYTYDSKGYKTQEVTTESGVGQVLAKPNTPNPTYTYALVMAGGAWTQDAIDKENSKSNLNDRYIIENKQVFTNDSKGQAVEVAQTYTAGSHNETWTGDEKTNSVDTVLSADGLAKFTYNKNGFPTKFVKTEYNKLTQSVIGGQTTTVDLTDTVSTYKYTYGSDMQLAKKTVTTKSPVELAELTYKNADGTNLSADELKALGITGTNGSKLVAVSGAVQTAVFGKDDVITQNVPQVGTIVLAPTSPTDYTVFASVVDYIYGDDYTNTTTYKYDLKDNSTVKTSEVAITKGGGDSTSNLRNWDYTVKKISVPSSRLLGVMTEQAKIQTDFDF